MINRMTQTSLLSIASLLVILQSAQASQIVEAVGEVSVRRNGAAAYATAGVGTVLNTGDLIRPEPQAQVTVLCSNNTTWAVPAGVPSGLENGCPDEVARFNIRGRGEDDFLAFLNQQFIYATQFLDPQPWFRWNPIENTEDTIIYTVQVTDETDTVLWEQTVAEPTAQYNGDALQPGKTYYLNVTATDQQNQSQSSSLTFRLLNESTASTVQNSIVQLQRADLSKTAEAIALTQVYQSVAQPNTDPPENAGLVMDAIGSLEAVTPQSQEPYLHRLLGDLYLQVGLLNAATTQYQTTLNLAATDRSRGNRAAAQVGLANIAAARGDRTAAKEWLRQASQEYEVSGDMEQVNLVNQWINKLEF